VDNVKKAAKKMAKLWDPTDPVHMRTEGYKVLAGAVADLAAEASVTRLLFHSRHRLDSSPTRRGDRVG
jgi:hypothetical protein